MWYLLFTTAASLLKAAILNFDLPRTDGRTPEGRTDRRTDGRTKDGTKKQKTKTNKTHTHSHKNKKNEGYFFMVSNDAEGHDDQNAYWIVKIGAILEG